MSHDLVAATDALHRWLAALNAPLDAAVVRAAVSEDVEILRHGNDEWRGQVVEQFHGVDEAVEWFSRCPPRIHFEMVSGPKSGEDGLWTARYCLQVDDFRGGGELRYRVDDHQHICWLEHVPDELAERYRMVD